MAEQILTAQILRELISYNQDDGAFTWACSRKGVTAGTDAGSITTGGYVSIRLFGKPYRAHRLAWLYVYEVWPSKHIDHINGDKTDNRRSNLRDVSAEINAQNKQGALKNNKTGLLGVCKHGKAFQARIWVGKKCIQLGTYPTSHEASEKYLEAKRFFHEGCTI